MADSSENESGGTTRGNRSEVSSGGAGCREQDRYLPIANVSRIMKKALPANAKISKEAKETVQECVSEFISFITGEASDKCQKEKRKTVNGDDLLWAITTLGFDDYVHPLNLYLHKYREMEGDKTVLLATHQPPPPTTDHTAHTDDGVMNMMMMGHHHHHHHHHRQGHM